MIIMMISEDFNAGYNLTKMIMMLNIIAVGVLRQLKCAQFIKISWEFIKHFTTIFCIYMYSKFYIGSIIGISS